MTTGISTLYVYSNNPGYYSCEVTTEEGTVVTHTVRMLDTTLYTGKIICILSNYNQLLYNLYYQNQRMEITTHTQLG